MAQTYRIRIRFMRYRPVFLVISIVLMAASVFFLVTRGVRRGIDFTGGLLMQLHFREPVDIGKIRQALAQVGLGDSTIQEYGSPENVIIRTSMERAEALARARGIRGELSTEVMLEQLVPEVTRAIYTIFHVDLQDKQDFNTTDRPRIQRFLMDKDPLGLKESAPDQMESRYSALAQQIYDARLELGGVLNDWKDLFARVDLPPAVRSMLQDHFVLGPFTIFSIESVGPQIGRELIRKAVTAVLVSLTFMLVYIWFRFDLVFGVMALMCLIHDVTILLGAMSFTGRELSLPVLAALLTVVGYDVNDTIIVYDRVRENRNARRFSNFIELFDVSLNQTLSRTLLTSLTTLFVLLVIYFFGGVVLNDFAFVMIVGVIAGTYSSIYIASSLSAYWYEWRQKRARATVPGRRRVPRTARAAGR